MITTAKRLGLVLLAIALTSSCASSRLHSQGMKDIDSGRYEDGLRKLDEAARAEPRNLDYRLALKAAHEEIVVKLLGAADRARGAGNLDEAHQNYQRVLTVEPGNDRAQRGLEAVDGDRRHQLIVAKAAEDVKAGEYDKAEAKLRAIIAEDPGFAAANALQAKLDVARGPIKITPRLKAHENRPVTLQFRDANTKMVFEVLSRQTGINFIFDKDVKSDSKTTLFVQQVPVEQAVELVLGQNQLARQVLSENMVLIYPNTPAKQTEYQDQIIKTFYLTNTEPKKAQELLKTVLNAKTLFVDDKANVLIMRDTPESVRMAEKLVASLDLAESEVMLEVEVLEISRSRLQQLGINYPTSATAATIPKLTLDTVGKLGASDISVTPLSISVDALKQTGTTNTLASPRIRARNREKAKILIGSRVPVITNSVTPTSSGTAVVTGNVQYLDVGLTLEVEPTVHLDNEVSIKMNLEVSNITKEVTVGTSGTLAYQIGTRNAQTLLSLKDGETQILAGLIQDSDTRNSSHIPGLGDIPIVGRLFGSQRDNKDKTEIVLSITPRVIRSAARPSSETTEFWYGTESNIRSAPLGSGAEAAASSTNGPVAPATGGMTPTSAPINTTTAVQSPGIAADAAASATVDSTRAAPAPVDAQKPSAPSGAPPTLAWTGSTQANVGQNFDVELTLDSAQPMTRMRTQLHFDAKVLQLLSAEAGDVVPSGLKATSVPKINQMAGIAQFVVPATSNNAVQGQGGLLKLHFKALSATPSTSVSLQFAAAGTGGSGLNVHLPGPLSVSVAQ